jgi:hypothetical protein
MKSVYSEHDICLGVDNSARKSGTSAGGMALTYVMALLFILNQWFRTGPDVAAKEP